MSKVLAAPEAVDVRCVIMLEFQPVVDKPHSKRFTLDGDYRKHDLAAGVIYTRSLWGKALMGKRLNDTVELCEGEGNVVNATIKAIGY